MSGHPSFIENHEDHKAALKFMREGCKPKDGIDYSWVTEYAKGLWKYRVDIFNQLDNKANSIITYLGGGTGLFALGVLAKVDSENAYLVPYTLPAVIAALASLACATSAKMPRHVPGLPTIKKAMLYADNNSPTPKAEAAFLGQWHLTCEYLRLTCKRKSGLVTWSTWLYLVAIALLIVPVGKAYFRPPERHEATPAIKEPQQSHLSPKD